MRKAVNIFLSSAVLLASSSAVVNAASPGAYVGAAGGYSTLQPAKDATTLTDGGLAGRAFAGYNVNHYFGIESNYSTFFKTRYMLNDYQNLAIDYKLNALSLAAKVYLPAPETSPFNLHASIGAAQMYANVDATWNSNALLSDSDSGLVGTIGFGASYDINPHFTADIEASVFGQKEPDFSHVGIPSAALVTLGLAYRI